MNSEFNIPLARNVRAAVIRSGIHRVFVNRIQRARDGIDRIVVISPWITPTGYGACPLSTLVSIIRTRSVPAFIFTRRPVKPDHLAAVQMLQACPTTEIIYNDNIHAKIYACVAAPPHSFALMGSANLTANSLLLYEIGLLILGVGPGSAIVDDLANFGLRYLRTRPESDVIKKIDYRGFRR
jgi:hypothetical protein